MECSPYFQHQTHINETLQRPNRNNQKGRIIKVRGGFFQERASFFFGGGGTGLFRTFKEILSQQNIYYGSQLNNKEAKMDQNDTLLHVEEGKTEGGVARIRSLSMHNTINFK
jgi:hypothetical protein